MGTIVDAQPHQQDTTAPLLAAVIDGGSGAADDCMALMAQRTEVIARVSSVRQAVSVLGTALREEDGAVVIVCPASRVAELAAAIPGDHAEPRMPLSARELQVLVLIADGLTNRQIAEQLGMAEQSVKNHISSLLSKLRATNRTAAVTAARQNGLLS
jgi:DNA-binding NarL/FixJ family response regulator